MINDLSSERKVLAEECGVDMKFLSTSTYDDFEESEKGFDIEVNLYQEDDETNICYRYSSICIKNSGEIVRADFINIPEEYREKMKIRSLAIFKVAYPNGV